MEKFVKNIQLISKSIKDRKLRFETIQSYIAHIEHKFPNYNISYQPLRWIKKGCVGKVVVMEKKPITRIIVGTAPKLYGWQSNLDAWAVVEIEKVR